MYPKCGFGAEATIGVVLEPELMLVMEWAWNGSLRGWLDQKKTSGEDVPEVTHAD